MSDRKNLPEFVYRSEKDYDITVRVNDSDVGAYSEKQLRKMYQNKDYPLLGETFENKKLDKEKDIGKIELAEKRLFVSKPGTHSTVLRKKAAFFAVADGYIALLKIRVLPIILAILLLIGCFAGAILLGMSRGQDNTEPAETTAEVDPNIKPIESDIITVTGYVTKGTVPVENAVVKLMKGNTLVATATTDKNGKYLFSEVKNGVYSVVCENEDKILTRSIVIDNADAAAEFDFTDSSEKFNAIVELESDETPAVAVEGIYKEVLDNIVEGKTTNIIFKAKELESEAVPAEDRELIVKSSGELSLTYLDFSVYKEIYAGTTLEQSTKITKTGNVFEVAVDYDSSKDVGTYVFRSHDGKAERFTELESRPESDYTDGTYYVTASTVFIYTDKFSVYAIGSAQVSHTVKGSDTLTYSSKVTVNLKTGDIAMLYQREESTHNAKVKLYLNGETSDLLIAESGIIPSSSRLENMTLLSGLTGMPSVGTYSGTMKIVYLSTDGAQADTNVDIPVTVVITQ